MGNFRNEEVFVEKMFPILDMILKWYQEKRINREELTFIWKLFLDLDRINITPNRKEIWGKALQIALDKAYSEIKE